MKVKTNVTHHLHIILIIAFPVKDGWPGRLRDHPSRDEWQAGQTLRKPCGQGGPWGEFCADPDATNEKLCGCPEVNNIMMQTLLQCACTMHNTRLIQSTKPNWNRSQVADEILEINGKPLHNSSHTEVINHIHNVRQCNKRWKHNNNVNMVKESFWRQYNCNISKSDLG